MIPKEEIRNLVNELYPAKSHRQSCVKCSEHLGHSFEFVYRSCLENSNYPVKRSFLKTLQALKLLRTISIINKELIKFDISY